MKRRSSREVPGRRRRAPAFVLLANTLRGKGERINRATATTRSPPRARSLPLLDTHAVPHPPRGYYPTDPDVRRARLRRFAGDLRSESMDALREAGWRDLRTELGRFAPEPQR